VRLAHPECKDCGPGHYNPRYDHATSKGFQKLTQASEFMGWRCEDGSPLNCPFSIVYVEDSSYYGFLMQDYIVLKDELARFNKETEREKKKYLGVAGCTTEENGKFYEQEADGIIGLGLETGHGRNPPDIVKVMHHQSRVSSPVFSLCFGHDGGYLTVGQFDPSRHHPRAKEEVFDFDGSQGQYKIALKKVSVDGEDIGATPAELNAGQGVFVDSGTTLIHGPSQVIEYSPLTSALLDRIDHICKQRLYNRSCGGLSKVKTSTRCFAYSQTPEYPTLEDWFESFPHVYMQFEPDAFIPLYPRDYFFLENGLQCLAFDYLDGRIILGGVFMRNFDLQFDRANHQVRMVRADCNPTPGFDFNSYYMAHKDDREAVHPIDPHKQPLSPEVDSSPATVAVRGEGTLRSADDLKKKTDSSIEDPSALTTSKQR